MDEKHKETLNKLEQITAQIKYTVEDLSRAYKETSEKMRDLCVDITNINVWFNQLKERQEKKEEKDG